jgi:anti-anti-sigma factor
VIITYESNRRVQNMPDEYFVLTEVGAANVLSLSLPEFMDSEEFDRINEQVLQIFETHNKTYWVLDVTGLNYAGSSVLGLFVNMRQRVMSARGQLILCGLSPQLLRIFRTCCMERLCKITRTRADALKSLGK